MELREIIRELENCACWEAIGINQLETTHFEPAFDAKAQEVIATAKRRAQALGEAVKLLKDPAISPLAAVVSGRSSERAEHVRLGLT
jgi:hypothetical protein